MKDNDRNKKRNSGSNENSMYRRRFLELAGTSTFLLTAAGEGTALVRQEDLRSAAKKHVAEKTGTDIDDLEVVNESVVEYNMIDEKYYSAKVMNKAEIRLHGAFLDADGAPVDRDSIDERASNAYEKKYGNLTAGLSETVSQMGPDETVTVGVWTNIDRAAAKEAARKEASSNVAERKQAVSEEIRRRSTNASNELAAKLRDVEEVEIEEVSSALPHVVVTATPRGIERIDQLEGIWAIFEHEGEFVEDLGSASKTHGSYSQRNDSFDCSGYDVGIFEAGGYPNNTKINRADTYGSASTTDHANYVARCAASTDDSLPGMAHNANVYCAHDSDTNVDAKLTWFDNKNVSAINCSFSDYEGGDRRIKSRDVQFGQFVKDNFVNIVTSAGNINSSHPNKNVATPGKAWNVVAVGAISDKQTGDDLSDDVMWSDSRWKNPETKNSDLHKPEVCAVGANIYVPGNYLLSKSGTSFSSPHVVGLITIMEKMSDNVAGPAIHTSPSLAKAVLLTSARHHVQTDSDGDNVTDKEGAGTIQAPVVQRIFNNGRWEHEQFDEANGKQTYTISLSSTDDDLRIALAWLNNPSSTDVDNSSAQPDIDLDLHLVDPNNIVVATSSSYDSCWEVITHEPTTSGTYTIEVEKWRWDASETDRWMGLAWDWL